MAVMRGRIPTKTMAHYMPLRSLPQKIVVSLFGNWMIKQYDFEECFFLENAFPSGAFVLAAASLHPR